MVNRRNITFTFLICFVIIVLFILIFQFELLNDIFLNEKGENSNFNSFPNNDNVLSLNLNALQYILGDDTDIVIDKLKQLGTYNKNSNENLIIQYVGNSDENCDSSDSINHRVEELENLLTEKENLFNQLVDIRESEYENEETEINKLKNEIKNLKSEKEANGFVFTIKHTFKLPIPFCLISEIFELKTTDYKTALMFENLYIQFSSKFVSRNFPIYPKTPLKDNQNEYLFGGQIIFDKSVDDLFATITIKSLDSNIYFNGDENKFSIVGSKTDHDVRVVQMCNHQCYGILNENLPLAFDFGIVDENNRWLTKSDRIFIKTGENKIFYIKPFLFSKSIYDKQSEQAFFATFMQSHGTTQSLWISSDYTEDFGYKLVIEGRDTGDFDLVIELIIIFGEQENFEVGPDPFLLGAHINHDFEHCEMMRHTLKNLPYVTVTGEQPPYVNKKCIDFETEGRWVRHEISEPCSPPICSGDKLSTLISEMSWQGTRNPFVYLPYNCYYHFYSPEDIKYCAAEKDIKWILALGDSLLREVAGYLLSIVHDGDREKFHSCDLELGDSGVRLTYLVWLDLLEATLNQDTHLFIDTKTGTRNITYTEYILKYYNILESDSSFVFNADREIISLGEFGDKDFEIQESSPDVFIMNPNMAYELFMMTRESHLKYMNELEQLVGDRMKLNSNIKKKIWYDNPFVYGQAHGGTDHLTEPRHRLFVEDTRSIIENMGFTFYNTTTASSSRPEDNWDGLHYLRTGGTEWRGQVSSTLVQVILNYVFEDCIGDPNI